MRLMLVTRNDDVRERLRTKWGEGGHDVVTCGDDAGPCRGVAAPNDCPLGLPVDLAVLVSQTPAATELDEMGYVCAQRHRVPTVTIDPILAADELWHVETETSTALHRLITEDARAVRERLPFRAEVQVRRDPSRLQVEVRCANDDGRPMSAKDRLTLADLARDAIRSHDPYVSVIDVNVVDVAVGDVEREQS